MPKKIKKEKSPLKNLPSAFNTFTEQQSYYLMAFLKTQVAADSLTRFQLLPNSKANPNSKSFEITNMKKK